MFSIFLQLHSILRWLVLVSLCYAIIRAARGRISKRPFTRSDNAVRHWTATIAHIQLLAGMLVYLKSPLTKWFRQAPRSAIHNSEASFFSLIHATAMLTAIVLITIGSAKAKRRPLDSDKFRTQQRWFIAALVLILVVIPWPFSPLAQRPLIR